MTFCLLPYRNNGPAQCVDVYYADGPEIEVQGRKMRKQAVKCMGAGFDTFDSRKADKPGRETTVATVMFE